MYLKLISPLQVQVSSCDSCKSSACGPLNCYNAAPVFGSNSGNTSLFTLCSPFYSLISFSSLSTSPLTTFPLSSLFSFLSLLSLLSLLSSLSFSPSLLCSFCPSLLSPLSLILEAGSQCWSSSSSRFDIDNTKYEVVPDVLGTVCDESHCCCLVVSFFFIFIFLLFLHYLVITPKQCSYFFDYCIG